jgi:hypothetical protein
MASPFRIFRKYQKTLLVVAGVILMFVFVIGDSLVAYLGGRPPGSGDVNRDAAAVAVTWNGGKLTNQELDQLVMRRRIVNSFLQGVHDAGVRSSILAGIEPRELRVQPIGGQQTERSVVTTQLFADAARDAGIRVSDEAIVAYLDELGRNRVSREEMRAMLQQAGGGRIPPQYMMDALREELLAHSYLASHLFAFRTVTPQQGYEDWLRVNDRVVVEAAAVPAESFVVDVPDPTDAELKAFFDEHKEREPQPDLIGQMELPSPIPGFRIPRKIDVQYIQAEYDPFLANVENEITEEEITKYYEENKDPLFVKADTGLFDSPSSAGTGTGRQEPAEKQSEPATETPPTNTETPSSDTGESSEQNAPPASGTGAESDTTSAPAGDTTVPMETDQSSLRGGSNNGVFRLAAFAQEPANESGETTSTTSDSPSQPADSGSVSDSSVDAGKTTATSSPDAGASGTSRAATTSTQPAAGQSSPGATATGTGADTAQTAEEKPKEFQPLDEVRDEIRTRLARDRVNEQLTDLMARLQSQVNADFTAYFGLRLDAESAGKAIPGPPAALTDLAPLANQHGLRHGKTGPMSWLEMRDTPVGVSGDIETTRELFRILFATEDLALYQPISTQDLDGNRYLTMKIGDTPGRIPRLEEKRAEVVRAWKLKKAAERAQKHAEDLAKQAQESNKSLADFFAGNQSVQVVRTDPFSRYTGGAISRDFQGQLQQQPFRLSEPDGIVAAGPDFMDEVFSLKDGEVGAVLNHDRSTAYIVRVAEHMLPTDALRDTYLTEAGNWPGMLLMNSDHARIVSSLLAADILKSRELTWNRDPDQQEQTGEEGPAEDE